MTVFFLCGLWHGASWNFVVWGLFHGAFLVFERLGLAGLVDRAPRPAGHVYALAVAMAGWVFFRADTLPHAMAFFAALAGLQGPVAPPFAVGYFVTPLVMMSMLAGVVGAGPRPAALGRRVLAWQPAGAWPRFAASAGVVLLLAAVFGVATLFVASSSYSPFIYFRF